MGEDVAQISNYRGILSGYTLSAPYGELTPGRSAIVTFAFPTVIPAHVAAESSAAAIASWRAFTATEASAARAALQVWADVSGLTFVEVKGGNADILFNKMDFDLTDASDAAAYAYYPLIYDTGDGTLTSEAIGSDVFLNSDLVFSSSELKHVLLHEIGHAIGLKHPFDTEDFNPDTLTAATDDGAHTVMTYNDYFPRLGSFDPQAAQAMYGVTDAANLASWSWNATTRSLTQTGTAAANTIYGTATLDMINGGAGDDELQGFGGSDTLQGGSGDDRLFGGDGDDLFPRPAGRDVIDGGDGFDALDLSGVTTAITMTPLFDADYRYAITFGSELIRIFSVEDIRGGSSTDTLGAYNHAGYDGGFSLFGNGGNDKLVVSLGNDRLDGGSGTDTAFLDSASSAAVVNLASTAAQRVGSSRDSFFNIENLVGTAYNDTLTGTDAKNSFLGGNGVDKLSGGGGVDRLDGGDGNDRLTGGDGRDIFVWGADTSARLYIGDKDTITDFGHDIDRIDLRGININEGYGGAADNFTWIGDRALTGAAGELHYRYSSGNTLVEGTLHSSSERFTIVLTGIVTLDRGDFILA